MSTKAEIENYLKNEFNMREGEGDLLIANYALEGDRSQVVIVGFEGDSGDESILIMSPFAEIGQVSAEKVLSAANLPIMNMDEYHVSARLFPVANLQPEEVAYLLGIVVGHADHMEQKLGLGDNL